MIEQLINICAGLVIGGYVFYTHFRIKNVERTIMEFPTPQELAKEIVKIKIPVNDMPPEFMEMVNDEKKRREMLDEMKEIVDKGKNKKLKKMDYVG